MTLTYAERINVSIMGMSAGQARLLSITARLSNNELRSQTITNSKLRLATESKEASQAYMEALNSTQLMYGSYSDDGSLSYQNLTANMLMNYGDLKNQYSLVNSSGQILVSGTDAKNFEKSKTLNEFLRASGVEMVNDISSIEIPDGLLQSAFNLLKSQYRCWGSTGIEGPSGTNTRFFSENAAHAEHVLAAMFWENTTAEQKLTITNQYNGKTETITNYANSLKVDYEDAFLVGITHYKYIGDFFDTYEPYPSADAQETKEFYIEGSTDDPSIPRKYVTAYLWKNKQSGAIHYTTFDVLSAESAGWLNPDGTINTTAAQADNVPGYYTNYPPLDGPALKVYNTVTDNFGLTLDSLNYEDKFKVKDILKENQDLSDRLKVLYYQILLFVENTADESAANFGGAPGDPYLKTYRGLTGGSITHYNAFEELTADEIVNEFTELMSELTFELIYDIYTSNDERMAMFEQIDGYEEIDRLLTDALYDTSDPKYRWYTNLWYRMGGTDGVKSENDTGNYKELDPNLENNSEWLQFALEHGIITMEQATFVEQGSDKYPAMGTYDWVSIIYTSASDFKSQENETAIALAEVKYKNAMTEIENKDKKYDQDLKKLDTEHNALQTEYESLKNTIDKNVERSFKAFS